MDEPACICFAQVLKRGLKNKPKPKPVSIPEELTEDPEIVENYPENKIDYNEHEIKIIEEALEESSKKIGLRPITLEDVEEEIKELKTRGLINDSMNQNNTNEIATKNLVIKFLKTNLGISEAQRNKIKIKQIYHQGKDNPDTIYIECNDKRDIEVITSRAKICQNTMMTR